MSSAYFLVFFLGLLVLATPAAANGGSAYDAERQKTLIDRFYARIKNKPSHVTELKPRDSEAALKTTIHLAEEASRKTIMNHEEQSPKVAGCPPGETSTNVAGEAHKSKQAGCSPAATTMNGVEQLAKPAGCPPGETSMNAAEEAPKNKPGGCLPAETAINQAKHPAKPAGCQPGATSMNAAGEAANSKVAGCPPGATSVNEWEKPPKPAAGRNAMVEGRKQKYQNPASAPKGGSD